VALSGNKKVKKDKKVQRKGRKSHTKKRNRNRSKGKKNL
jgi:hypothetical protein